MNVSDYVTLYDYNYWANYRMLDSLAPISNDEFTREMPGSFGSLRDTLVHIIGAEWLWLSRWRGEGSPTIFDARTFSNVAALRDRWQSVEGAVKRYIRELTEADITGILNYRNLKGEPFSVPLGQALQHVANHSTYHRGQITTLLRQLGHPAQSTDMLYFYIERNSQAAGQG